MAKFIKLKSVMAYSQGNSDRHGNKLSAEEMFNKHLSDEGLNADAVVSMTSYTSGPYSTYTMWYKKEIDV